MPTITLEISISFKLTNAKSSIIYDNIIDQDNSAIGNDRSTKFCGQWSAGCSDFGTHFNYYPFPNRMAKSSLGKGKTRPENGQSMTDAKLNPVLNGTRADEGKGQDEGKGVLFLLCTSHESIKHVLRFSENDKKY